MKRLRILCSQKINSGVNKTGISHIGGVNARGEKWKFSAKEAVAGIHSGNYEFFIVENFAELNVRITEDEPLGLSANVLGYPHNLLEDLPDCP